MARKSKTAPRISGILEEMTIEEVRAFKPQVAVLPLGSTEPHGPHLPYGTDTIVANTLGRMGVLKANARGARAILYPALPITNNVNFRKLPFGCRIGVRTLMNILVDIATQCREDGVMKLVLLNCHGGNVGTIQAALREIHGMDNMPFVCAATRLMPEGFKTPIEHWSDHAGEEETSVIMVARPDLVRKKKLGPNPTGKLKIPNLSKLADFVRPWHLYLPTSACGETRKASQEKGRIVLGARSDGLAELLVQLSKAKFDARFPYE
ncbi:MAG TPA: creatininase family protein [Planctomycetota bacterium]|nr:creatininase family protein [Planctomycetota bacterium]